MSWTPLHSSIVTSTIWREPHHVRIVWVTMLAMANRYGIFEGSVPGLADMARVTLEECLDALERLSSPDKWSRTKEHDGRRIEAVDGGWILLTYPKHRAETHCTKRAEYQREWIAEKRRRQRAQPPVDMSTSVDRVDTPDPDPDPDPKKRKKNTCRVSGDVQRVFEAWRQDTGHARAILDAKRAERIRARLNEGFTADELILAITHRHNDPWLMGKGNSPRVFDEIKTLLRDAAQVERLRDLTEPLPDRGNGRPVNRHQQEMDALKERLSNMSPVKGLPS